MENETARFIKILWSVTFAIILGASIFSVVAFLLGYSPQAGTIITVLLGGVIVYSLVGFFVFLPYLFSSIKVALAGFFELTLTMRDLRTKTEVFEADAKEGKKSEEMRAIKEAETASSEEVNEIQESDTSALGIFLQLQNEIETKIRIISQREGLSGYKYAPIAQYARDLEKRSVISPRLVALIQDFRAIRNKVIHSTRDVSRSQ